MGDEVSPAVQTVLIVEDDSRIADFLTRGLRASGFTPEWVTTAGEALERIEAGGIAVQILDLGLPDFDGLVLVQELIKRGAMVPTVIVTARSDPKDRVTAQSLGVHSYLTKPFAWKDLLAVVRALAGEQAS